MEKPCWIDQAQFFELGMINIHWFIIDWFDGTRPAPRRNDKDTEIYAKFDPRRLEQDFPDLVQKNMLRPIYPTQDVSVG